MANPLTNPFGAPGSTSKPRPLVGPGAPAFGSPGNSDLDAQSVPPGGPTPFNNEHVTPGQTPVDPIGGGSLKVPEKPFSVG